MRSHLTKHILRRLYHSALYNDPRHNVLPLSPQCAFARRPTHQPLLRAANTQHRTLFNFFRRTKSGSKQARLTPGYNVLIDLENKLKVRVRPPQAEDVSESLRKFVNAKYEQDEVKLDDTQVRRIKVAFEHLKSEASKGIWQGQFTPEDVGRILQMLAKTAVSFANKEPVLELARAMLEESQRLNEGESSVEQRRYDRFAYISIIASCGKALEAKRMLFEAWEDQQTLYWTCINRIACGLIKEGLDEDLRHFVSELEAHGVPMNANLQRYIVGEYAQSRKSLEQAYYWYKVPLSAQELPSSKSRRMLLGLCIQSDDIKLGDELVREITEQDADDKMAIDQVLQWAVCKGKGLDAIARMIQTMRERHHDKPELQPNMSTLNALAGLAISKFDDPYTAERYIEMGQQFGLQPNASTHVLQMKYKTERKDFSGALAAFDALRNFNMSEIDTVAVNQLIAALCEHEGQNHEGIMSVVDYLSDRKAQFLPATVAALGKFHLYRHELDDAKDLITMYAQTFGTIDRELVCVSMIDYILDPESDTKQAWDAWTIVRRAFPETPVSVRTQVMKAFFKRNRSDLATHTFGQMRFSDIPELRPSLDTYIDCIVAIGEAWDLEQLDNVHNMLKLDTEVEPCTRIFNALMLSYARCDKPRRALRFWDTIVGSVEGPTIQSIKIAFKACEGVNRSDTQEIFDYLKSSEFEMTRELYAAYVGASTSHQRLEVGAALVKNALRLGFEIDALL